MHTTITATLVIRTLEPGFHIDRKPISQRPWVVVELPREECSEVRTDWGEYRPVLTFPAIFRALKARGHMPPLDYGEEYQLSIVEN